MKGWIRLTRITSNNAKEKMRVLQTREIYVQVQNITNVVKKHDSNPTAVSFIGDDCNYVEVLESPDAVINLIRSSYEDT